MRIKDISKNNRPRERLQKEGIEVLSEAELLAIILKIGNKQENVIDMCNRLISKYGLNNLAELSLTELQQIKGIGPAKAMQIKAVFEFNKRYQLIKQEQKIIKSAKDVFNYASQRLKENHKEQFMILHLDSKNKIIKDEIVTVGILNASLVHPREVFRSAIKEATNSIIITHNHPSGDPSPSLEDQRITARLKECGELLEIQVLDHVIIGNNQYYSFKENE